MAATIFNDGKFQAIDNSGNIVPYGKVYFIDVATGSPVQTYSDAKMTITNPHPVVLSASGKADIFLGDATYDITLKDKNGATVWTINNFIPTTGNGTLIPAVVIPTKEEFTNIVGSTIILANTPLTTVDIYKNGLMLNTDEYSLDTNTIVFTTPLIASDEIVVELTKVIDSEFNPAIAYPYDTLNDLISSSVVYRKVWVSGYHTKGDGAFGSHIFEWDATSTEADNSGTIIKLTNVATGRYKLRYNGAVYVKWFGAIGDGITDDYSAFQNTWDYVEGKVSTINGVFYRGGKIYIENGGYRLSDRVYSTSDKSNQDVNIEIIGESRKNTKILVDNTLGFIRWVKTNYGLFFSIRNISIFAYFSTSTNTPQTNNGIAIDIEQNTSGNRHDRHIYIENITLSPYDKVTNKDYFGISIKIVGGGRALINDVVIDSIFDQNNQNTWISDYCLLLQDHYGPYIKNSKFYGANTGIDYQATVDPGAEGGNFQNLVVDSNTAIHVKTPSVSGEPGLFITKTHCNYGSAGIFIENKKFISIVDCLIYNETDNSFGNPVDILLNNVDDSRISSTLFSFVKNTNRTAIKAIGTLSTTSKLLITGCTFANSGYVMSYNSSVNGISFMGNQIIYEATNGKFVPNGATYVVEPFVSAYPGGTPEGVVYAPEGSTQLRQDGTNSSYLYIKTTDIASNTGWLPYSEMKSLLVSGDSITFSGLPTSDPLVNGRVWNNAGVLTVSAG